MQHVRRRGGAIKIIIIANRVCSVRVYVNVSMYAERDGAIGTIMLANTHLKTPQLQSHAGSHHNNLPGIFAHALLCACVCVYIMYTHL